jgi:hypothetical protein
LDSRGAAIEGLVRGGERGGGGGKRERALSGFGGSSIAHLIVCQHAEPDGHNRAGGDLLAR